MDCRDWIVLKPEEVGMSDEVAGSPLLAVLSTVLLGRDFEEASCVLTACLLDEDMPPMRQVKPGAVAAELVDLEDSDEAVRYLLPTPDGELALLAEFAIAGGMSREMYERIEALMASFHWLT
jgi:hypothetical protein